MLIIGYYHYYHYIWQCKIKNMQTRERRREIDLNGFVREISGMPWGPITSLFFLNCLMAETGEKKMSGAMW